MLQLVLAPTKGWEDVAAEKAEAADLFRRGVVPMFAWAAVSIFAQMLFHSHVDLVMLFIGACVVFVSYFASYALAGPLFESRIDRLEARPLSGRCRVVVCYALGLMAATTSLCNFMPLSLGLGYLLPLAVTLIVWKSMAYLDIPENREYEFLVSIFLIITLPPVVIQALFSWILGEGL